ncbi:MAG: alpha-2-macroglobulin [Chitinophagaceae bacterium]|nr:alpha-2-macroglobulin [Chitinophagaceae bacterium]
MNTNGQDPEYKKEWAEVEKAISNRLPQTAIATINQIYHSARQSDNEPQIVKCLLYKAYYGSNLQEDAEKAMIDSMRMEIDKASQPAKSVLQNITAQYYQNYFAQNRYRLYSATETVDFQKDDIDTWSKEDFFREISSLYRESLKDERLKTIPVDQFDAIISKGNARQLRPTLFDLLAHRALSFFVNPEIAITKAANAFEITDPATFAPARAFIKVKFPTSDTSSPALIALGIYQELIGLHMNSIDALVDVDLERLKYVFDNARMQGKDELYMAALQNIYESYKDPSVALAGYFWAEQLINTVAKEQDPAKKGRRMVEAMDILRRVYKDYPKSEGGTYAFNLINETVFPAIRLQLEKVNVPGKDFRALTGFKNVDTVYLRVARLTPRLKNQISNSRNLKNVYATAASIKEWTQPLPSIKDYLEHSAEIRVEGLPVGEYLLIASTKKNFGDEKSVLSASEFYVSDISYIRNESDLLVLNRSTGAPLDKARIKVWAESYNYNSRKYEYKLLTHLETDAKGHATLPKDLNASIRFEVSYKDDYLFLDNREYYYAYTGTPESRDSLLSLQEYEKKYTRMFYFTDRSIYRPGQTVYFKVIGITRDRESGLYRLLADKLPLNITLYNTNGQKVDSVRAELNDFGSLAGKFTLPQNQLNGTFRISVDGYSTYSHYISVEEYKRPKFYAEIEQPEQSFKIDDTIQIRGNAIAYAGNTVDGAKVTYRITRMARFPYLWRFWRIGIPSTSSQEIVNGETVTNADGSFYITFRAIPDLALDPENDPIFDYRISVDVTDINGETRSAEATIPVGYKSLNLLLAVTNKGTYRSTDFRKITVAAQNLSGKPQNVSSALKIYELKSPGRMLRERLWQTPDTTVMSEKEFVKYFPNDPYRDEDQPETWERGRAVYSLIDSINGTGEFALQKGLKSGWYVATVSSEDRYGNPVEDVKYFRVFDPQSKKLPGDDFFFLSDKSVTGQPGETKTVYIGSSADIYLFTEMVTQEETERSKDEMALTRLNNKMQPFDFSINESDRGGYAKNFFFIKDNRFYSAQIYVAVPWDNKKLDIRFDTYREKTIPGSEEQWKITISGKNNSKVAAELLAGMYDESLDQFKPQKWNPLNVWSNFYPRSSWVTSGNFTSINSSNYSYERNYKNYPSKTYDYIVMLSYYSGSGIFRPMRNMAILKSEPSVAVDEATENMVQYNREAPSGGGKLDEIIQPTPVENSEVIEAKEQESEAPPVKIRSDFRETAFFFPQLRTDEEGNVSFSFTMPEALTKWKLMALAHTRDLSSGYAEKSVVTQKDLMVMPNAPRFFREGDSVVFSAKVVNITDHEISGRTSFHLLNSSTLLPVDGWFKLNSDTQPFTIPAGQSVAVSFSFVVPKGFNDVVTYKIVAETTGMSDGEEALIPVVTNRMLVTEALPLPMKRTGSQNFVFEKLKNSGNSATLSNFGLTVEYTPNPAWYAVQALPYLNEYPYECTEQIFNRYFANALAMHIANASPRLKEVFEKWRQLGPDAFMSNLQKNQELKSVLLEETPWVMAAKSEEQQKKNIALLFDLNTMRGQLGRTLQIVKERQTPNGGFPWFTQGPDDRYITQYILADMGHLKQLKAWPKGSEADLNIMANKALKYLDRRIAEDLSNLKKIKNFKPEDNHLSYIAVHYLYTRSFFKMIAVSKEGREAYDYFYDQIKRYWKTQNLYSRGLIALILHRSGETKISNAILRSLKENAIVNPELGMYWKELTQRSFWWYQAPIETQSVMIEVFSEVGNDAEAVGELKTWLLKNKQTNNWKSTKATAEAVYALLLQGEDWFSAEKNVKITLGDLEFDNKNEIQEDGTGYFKRRIDGAYVTPDMGNINVTVTQEGSKPGEINPSWGAVYWQYFEDLDKITFAETPLKLSKKLFVQKNSDHGPVLSPVNEGDELKIGDKITVRIELRSDRDMEYVHMKDMRASAMEPVDVLSGYHRQGALGYYQSTKDVSTNFFFNYLPKGTYVFEYSMFVTHAGDFSNGITSIQCMYAPEFTAHSEGVRVKVSD